MPNTAAPTDAFPILDCCVYLNHAAIAPWPRAVIDAAGRFAEDNARRGPLGYGEWMKVEARLRRRLAELLGARSADDVALVQNTSMGLNLVASGIDWAPGDAVVFPAGEFPSNALPWQALAGRGVEVREVPFDADDPESALIAALDDRVRLLAVSSVRYDSGVRLDIERLGRAAHAHGARLCVDAIQELGARPIDVGRCGADYVVAGAHKWLLAPEGLAVFWSDPDARAGLRQTQHGWRIHEDMFDFSRPGRPPPESGRRFEPGTLSMFGIHGLDAAVGLLLETGPDAVGELILARSGRLIDGLETIPGIRLITPRAARRRAGIVSFIPPSGSAKELVGGLAARNIHAAPRGPAVRLSPHFYTPTEQLDRTLEAIQEITGN